MLALGEAARAPPLFTFCVLWALRLADVWTLTILALAFLRRRATDLAATEAVLVAAMTCGDSRNRANLAFPLVYSLLDGDKNELLRALVVTLAVVYSFRVCDDTAFAATFVLANAPSLAGLGGVGGGVGGDDVGRWLDRLQTLVAAARRCAADSTKRRVAGDEQEHGD